jgi:muramoyltetrapeptide carboxypeptidase
VTRRDFAVAVTLATETALQAAPGAPLPLIKPPALRNGDTIGLITPSSNVTDPADIELAVKTVRELGLNPKLGRNTNKRRGYLAGTVQERLDDLHTMFRDPDVRGIWCIRGGYGAMQLLDQIDYGMVRAHPKVFLGYSDITALHLAFNRLSGLVTFHGPVVIFHGGVAPLSTSYTVANLQKILFQKEPAGRLVNPAAADGTPTPEHRVQTIRGGRAHGRLIGGNLSLLTALMGTPWEIDTRKAIVFSEEIGEAPYRVDRMLTQLRLAGKFSTAAGVIFGECTDCGTSECKGSPPEPTLSIAEVLSAIIGPARVPAFGGLTIGHTIEQLTLPLGIMATMDADRGDLVIEEAAVS